METPPGHLAEELHNLLLILVSQGSSAAMPSVAPPVWSTIFLIDLILKPCIVKKNPTDGWLTGKTHP